MRQSIEGDFIFLDADAVPVRPFHRIATTSEDIAAVRDCLRVPPGQWYTWRLLLRHWTEKPPVPPDVQPLYEKMGWSYPPRYYFNTGVLYMRDTPAARKLGEEWHGRWRRQFDTLGRHEDQFAFNTAVKDLSVPVRVLSSRYNAMVKTSPWYAHRASIFHFFTSGKSPEPGTILAQLVKCFQETKGLDADAVERFCRSGYPWTAESWLLLAAAGNYSGAWPLISRRLFGWRKNPAAEVPSKQ
jgi:hypothetical protein